MDDAGRGSSGTAVFPIPQIPAALLIPPPPPLPSSSYSAFSPRRHAPPLTSFPILVLTVIGVLTTSVLLLAYYVLVIRCCLKWHRQGSTTPGPAASSSSSTGTTTTATLPTVSSSGTPEARGLDDAAIRALPAFRYSKAANKSAGECAVCLGELEEEERVRMLPACLHVFHVDCVDVWLHGNANCPLCRTPITAHCQQLVPPPLEHHLPRRHDEVVIVPVTDQHQQQASTTRTSTDEQVSSDYKRVTSRDAWHHIDIKADDVERKDRDVLPLMRRSFSMDSIMAGRELHLQIHSILQTNAAHIHGHGDDTDSTSTSTSSV